MISEGKRLRIASKVSDAVLAAAAAATMAQGPRDFVSFGAIQSPGVVRGQEEGRKRGEADRNLDSGRVSHSARNKKMKTFREFLEEATNKHGIDSDSYSKWISAAEKAHNETGTIKSIAQQTHNGVDYVLRQKGHYKNGKPRFAVTPKKAKQNTEERRQAKKRDLSSHEDMIKGNEKESKLKKAGLETHHITPLEYSEKLKASMSDSEWEAKKIKDAENGIYHGHHHKNLMGTVGPKTPQERRIRTAIQHRTGGAHEVERQTRELYSGSISHKDLLASAHRQKMRKERSNK
jgi:hypothetical protein